MLNNHVREWRLERSYSSEEVAQAARITRQALGQIEAGKVCPSTAVAIRLCRFFGCTVEELFYEDNLTFEAKLVNSEKQIHSKHVYLSKIANQWIAREANPVMNYDLFSDAHGILQSEPKLDGPGQMQVQVEVSGDPERMARTVFISGCDVGLGYLAAYTRNQANHTNPVWFNTTNQQALFELENRQTQIAAVHFSNDSIELLRAWLCNLACKVRIYEFASADIGWITMPKSNQFLAPDRQIQLPDIRIVNRPVGAGARRILDSLLKRSGISQNQVKGYKNEVGGHLSVANAISDGFADAGIGHVAAAVRFGLSFTPVINERCALIIREEDTQNRGVEQILTTLCSGNFRKGLASFGPYDTSCSGTEIPVAKR